MTLNVIEHTRDDIAWPFEGEPKIYVGPGRSRRTVTVDPTPAYPHDHGLVADILEKVAQKFPIDWPVTVHVLPVEEVGRTNGATSIDCVYDYDAPLVNNRYPATYHPTIHLSGKRIPPHPAMTRYLVAHEYGHVVEEWLNLGWGGKELWDDTLIREYAELRKLPARPSSYGAGTWHAAHGEVFANDFRILVCGIEREFWPHPGIERPDGLHAVRRFWRNAVRRSNTQSSEAAA